MDLSFARLAVRTAASAARRRPLPTLLAAGVLAGAAAVVTIALAVGRIADEPWQRTFEATRGSHVEAFAFNGSGDPSGLAGLPGVAVAAPPWEEALVPLAAGGRRLTARIVAGPDPAGPVARPVMTAGRWLRPGELVAERSFAQSVGLRAGEHVRVGSRRMRLVGIAVSTSREQYPRSQPGTLFVGRADLRALVPAAGRNPVRAVRLAAPARSTEFVAAARAALPGVAFVDWQEIRRRATTADASRTVALASMAIFLLLAAGAVVGVTVSARVLEREREVGVLRAIGLTPVQVAILFVCEYALLALGGALAGLALGRAVAPALTEASAAVLGGSEVPLSAADAALVVAGVVGLSMAAVAVPALRTARRPAAASLGAGARTRAGRLAPWLTARGLPLPVVLGAGQATARPGRAALTAFTLGLSVVAVVATLSMEATFDAQAREQGAPRPLPALPGAATAAPAPPAPTGVDAGGEDTDALRPIVYPLAAALIVVGLLNLLAVSLLGVRERRRDHAILRTLGLGRRGVLASVAAAGGLQGALAALAGIPLGIGFFQLAKALADGGEGGAVPAAWTLALVLPAAVVLATLAALGPAALAARQPPGDALRHE